MKITAPFQVRPCHAVTLSRREIPRIHRPVGPGTARRIVRASSLLVIFVVPDNGVQRFVDQRPIGAQPCFTCFD